MTNEPPESNEQELSRHPFDLEERSSRFGEDVITLLKAVRVTPLTEPLIKQLVRSAGSVGANYCEANDAQSKKEFRHRIFTCRKEAKESKHWLRLLAKADDAVVPRARELWQEGKELNLILSAILRKL